VKSRKEFNFLILHEGNIIYKEKYLYKCIIRENKFKKSIARENIRKKET